MLSLYSLPSKSFSETLLRSRSSKSESETFERSIKSCVQSIKSLCTAARSPHERRSGEQAAVHMLEL